MDLSANVRTNINTSGMHRDLVLVEYPGLIRNEENMIKTLGGISTISQVFSGEKRRMELRFHPDNIFNKPACGDMLQTAGLLLRVRIRRNKYKKTQLPTHSIEVLGCCKRTVKFESLCEHQYLPFLRNPQTNQTEYIYNEVVPKDVLDLDWFSREQSLFLVPPVFSRVDTVSKNGFRKDRKDDSNPEVLGIARSKYLDGNCFQTFSMTESFPMKPSLAVVKRLTVKYVSDKQLEKVKSLFDECPIWNRTSLLYESRVLSDKLKSILPSVAFYFTNGPWRTMYVRYGYDPRKDFKSRYYQLFDFRLKLDPAFTHYIKNKNRAIKEAKRAGPQPSSSQGIVQDVNYPYLEEGSLPRCRQSIYRYCDLKFPKIQEMLEKIPTPLSGATCNEKTGWLPPGFDDQCRQYLMQYVKEQLKNIKRSQNTNGAEEEDFSEDDEEEEDEMSELKEYEQMDIDDKTKVQLNK